MNSGVYQIRNLVNDKIYVGSSKHLTQSNSTKLAMSTEKIRRNYLLGMKNAGKLKNENLLKELDYLCQSD